MFTELWSDLRYRLRALFRRGDVERELDDELRDHLEREAAANRAAGVAPEDAMRRARVAFGGVENARERSRDGRGIRWLEIVARDLRLAGRSLRRDAGFTAIAVLSLAVGICMSAGVVTMLQSVYSGGLSFRNIDGVVALYRPTSGSLSSRSYYFTGPAIRSMIERSTQLRDAALLHSKSLRVRTDSSDSWISGAEATPALFSMLGVRPEIGRVFDPGDGSPGGPNVILISHDYWVSRFGGDRHALDRTLTFGGTSYRVVGVVPREMTFPSYAKVWIARSAESLLADSTVDLQAFASMTPGASVRRVNAELTVIARSDSLAHQLHGPLGVVRVVPFRDYLTDQFAGLLYLLGAIAIALGLIASVNFAALVLARGMHRREELGIRAALGASTTRLVTHMLAECAVLGFTGGALGALVAPAVVLGIDRLLPNIVPPWLHPVWGLDAAGAAIALAVALGVIFGIAPAIELARPAAAGFLRTGTGGSIGLKRQRSGRRALVTFQVFLAIAPVVFLAIAIGPALSFGSADGGIDLHGLYSGSVFRSGIHDTVSASPQVRTQMLNVIRAVPGVRFAATSLDLYLSNTGIEVDSGRPGQFVAIGGRGGPWHGVSDQYFETMRPRLLVGRFPTDNELLHGAPVAVVSRHTATALVGGLRTGWQIRMGMSGSGWVTATVVAVVDDVVPFGLGQLPYVEIYSPIGAIGAPDFWAESVWMRSAERPWRVVPAAYAALHAQMPDVNLIDLQLRVQTLAAVTRQIRAILIMIGGSFAIAVALAAIGIYGIVAYSAASRRQELAIRVALGAARMNVAFLVTREAAVQTLVGVVLGIAGGAAAVMYLTPNPDVLKSPPVNVIAVCCSTMLISLLVASLVPIRRVWRTDVATVLREDG